MPRKFLVVADDSPEFDSALRFAARRARSTGGRVVLLRAIPPSAFEHWSGVREEIMRQQREEAEALLNRLGEKAAVGESEKTAEAAVDAWVGDRLGIAEGVRRAVDEIEQSSHGWSFAKLTIANVAVRDFAAAAAQSMASRRST